MEARKIEQELLANIIEFGAPHDFALIRRILKAEDFSEEKHREIWEMVCAIADKGEAIDIMRVFVEARARGLSNPADIVTMGADKCRGEMAALAMDIAIEAKRRSLVEALRHGIEEAEGGDPYATATEVRQKLDSICKRTDSVQPYSSLYTSVLIQMQAVLRGEAPEQVLTGFRYIDRKGGLRAGDLDIIAGRTSNGKTAFSMAIAINVASGGTPVGVFSMEMTNIEIAKRVVAMQAEVPCRQVDRPDSAQVLESVQTKASPSIPLYFDGSNANTADAIIGQMRMMARELGCKVFVVDYLQQLTKPGADKRTIVSEASVALKNAAKELGCTVIALSQLARCDDPVPYMHQLKEAGEIENSADNVYLVYRAELYRNKSHFPAPYDTTPSQGLAMVFNPKSRNGSIGEFLVSFVPEMTKFTDTVEGATPVDRDMLFANSSRNDCPF